MAGAQRIYRSQNRILLSRIFAVLLLLVFLFTKSPELLRFPTIIVLGLLGLLLATLGAFGRVWSSVYIAGRKTNELVDQGPYSITRNPLYVFSLLGAVGLGLASCNPVVLILLLALFILYYPGVISKEEAKLRRKHGDSFEEYMATVPRILPHFSLFRQPEQITVNPKPITRAFTDAIWFIVGYVALRALVWLHAFSFLPALELPLF